MKVLSEPDGNVSLVLRRAFAQLSSPDADHLWSKYGASRWATVERIKVLSIL